MRLQTGQRHKPAYLLILVFLLVGASGCGSNQPSSAEATAQASRAISMATQVAANLRATKEVESLQVEATIQAMESLLLQAEQWPVIIDERFDHNELNWPTGDGDDPLAVVHWEIRDSQYHWQAVANEPFVWWATPDIDAYSNFYLAVDLQQLEGPPDGEAGLVFRLSEGDYYLFEINANQQYSVYLHSQEGWEAIRDWQVTETISEDSPSRLSVIADREFLLLFINGHYLTTLFDTRLTSGNAGVLAGLSNAGDEGSWAFDNFVLQTPDMTVP
jgi:hypothetical protein